MTKKILTILMVGALALTSGCGGNNGNNNENAEAVNNNENNTVSVEAEVEEDEPVDELRVVGGSVAVTNVLEQLDMDLVGVPTTSSTLPERYEDVAEIGMAHGPDFEVIVSLEPDLLIFDANFEDSLKPLAEEYEIDTYFFNTGTYELYINSIEELGNEINREEEAAALISDLTGQVDGVLAEIDESEEVPSVVILFGTSESFMLATEVSYIGDLVKTVGAKNVASELTDIPTPYLDLSLEEVVAAEPDYILRFSHGDIEAAEAAYDEQFASNPAWQALDAVQEERVYDLDSTMFGTTANLRVADAIEFLAEILY